MNLPNKLTVTRMVLVPLIIAIYLLEFGKNFTILGMHIPAYQLVVLVLFSIASITDYLDGNIARKNHLITTFGKFMDPIADKLLVNSLIILLACSGKIHVIVPIIMIGRDTIVDAIRFIAASNNKVIAASKLGKAKTVTQMIGIIIVLLNNYPFELLHLPVATIAIALATIISAISGYDYFIKNKDFIFESM